MTLPRGVGKRLTAALREPTWLDRSESRFMGVPREVTPHDALLNSLRTKNAEIEYCNEQLLQLTEEEIFERNGRNDVVVSRWLARRDAAIADVVRISKLCSEVNVEQRQVQLAEQQANIIERYFEAVLNDLGLTREQRRRLGPAMREHLPLIEAAETEPAVEAQSPASVPLRRIDRVNR